MTEAAQAPVPAAARQAVLERAQGACERCGSRGEAWKGKKAFLSIHHKRHRAAGGGHTPENLELLCAPCHGKEHERRKPEGPKPRPSKKEPTSFHLTPAAKDLLRKLSDKTGVAQAHVLELLIRREARKDNLL